MGAPSLFAPLKREERKKGEMLNEIYVLYSNSVCTYMDELPAGEITHPVPISPHRPT